MLSLHDLAGIALGGQQPARAGLRPGAGGRGRLGRGVGVGGRLGRGVCLGRGGRGLANAFRARARRMNARRSRVSFLRKKEKSTGQTHSGCRLKRPMRQGAIEP